MNAVDACSDLLFLGSYIGFYRPGIFTKCLTKIIDPFLIMGVENLNTFWIYFENIIEKFDFCEKEAFSFIINDLHCYDAIIDAIIKKRIL